MQRLHDDMVGLVFHCPPEGQDPVVLEHDGGRDFLGDDFVKDGPILRVSLASVENGVPSITRNVSQAWGEGSGEQTTDRSEGTHTSVKHEAEARVCNRSLQSYNEHAISRAH